MSQVHPSIAKAMVWEERMEAVRRLRDRLPLQFTVRDVQSHTGWDAVQVRLTLGRMVRQRELKVVQNNYSRLPRVWQWTDVLLPSKHQFKKELEAISQRLQDLTVLSQNLPADLTSLTALETALGQMLHQVKTLKARIYRYRTAAAQNTERQPSL